MTSQRQVGMLGTQSISVDSQGQANLENDLCVAENPAREDFPGP